MVRGGATSLVHIFVFGIISSESPPVNSTTGAPPRSLRDRTSAAPRQATSARPPVAPAAPTAAASTQKRLNVRDGITPLSAKPQAALPDRR